MYPPDGKQATSQMFRRCLKKRIENWELKIFNCQLQISRFHAWARRAAFAELPRTLNERPGASGGMPDAPDPGSGSRPFAPDSLDLSPAPS
jgi:hypothetical protein